MLTLRNWSDKDLLRKPALFIQPLEFDSIISAHSWAYPKYDKWIENLSNSEFKAIYSYCLNDNKQINPYLRNNTPHTDDTIKEKVATLSGCLRKATVPENIIVYRGIDVKALEDYFGGNCMDAIGKDFVEKGFLSTSMVKKVAQRFSKGALLKIAVPRGSNGAYVGTISEKLEAEILFNRNQNIRITDVNKIDNQYIIDCTLMPSIKINLSFLKA
jgi:hypothetical protein